MKFISKKYVVDYRDKLLLPLIGDVLHIFTFNARGTIYNKNKVDSFKKEEILYGG